MKRYSQGQIVSDSTKYNDDSLQSSTPGSFKSLPVVSFPTFPKMHEIVHPRTFEVLAPLENVLAMRPVGLFEGLLQGHVELLADDVAASPEKYAPEATALIQEMMQGMKSMKLLTLQERSILDKATLDFAAHVPPKTKPSLPTPSPARAKKRDETPENAAPTPGLDTPPEADTPAYWWLR